MIRDLVRREENHQDLEIATHGNVDGQIAETTAARGSFACGCARRPSNETGEL